MSARFVFQPSTTLTAEFNIGEDWAIADLDADGVVEIILAPTLGRQAGSTELGTAIFHYDAAAGLIPYALTDSTGAALTTSWVQDMVVADFNGDGRLDVLIGDHGVETGGAANYPGGRLQLWLAGAAGPTVVVVSSDLGERAFWHQTAAADFNGDGWLDVVSLNLHQNLLPSINLAIFANRGGLDFDLDMTLVPVGADAEQTRNALAATLAAGDLDGDGRADLVVGPLYDIWNTPATPRETRIYWGDGTGPGDAYTALPMPDAATLGIDPYGIATDKLTLADLNNDGLMDVIVMLANLQTEQGRWGQVFLQGPDRTFTELDVWDDNALPQFASFSSGDGIDAVDVNGDGLIDLHFAHSFTYNTDQILATTYINMGDGTFQPLSTLASDLLEAIPFVSTFSWARWGDLDGDGQAELFGLRQVSWDASAGSTMQYYSYRLQNDDAIYATAGMAVGTIFADNIIGSDQSDRIEGGLGHDRLLGESGDDILDGGLGVDTLEGGLGDDAYYADSNSDVLVEAKDQGRDTVYASVSYTLQAGVYVEALTLTGSGNINGTGNGIANTLRGNAGNNLLNGAAGADKMYGGKGDDTFHVDNSGDKAYEANGDGTDTVISSVSYSLAGQYIEHLTLTGSANLNATGNTLNNTLTGNAGINVLTGGKGNDAYVVQNATDSIVELKGEGTDTVFSSVSFVLKSGSYVEALTLTGTADLSATGNGIANVLTGNSGKNVLNGGAGADRMAGGLGDDSYYVDNKGDVVVEAKGQGTDWVYSSVDYSLKGQYVEYLTLTGSADVYAKGNTLDNRLVGNSGDNRINGMEGQDRLTGGAGADTFIWDATSHSKVNDSDRIVDLTNEDFIDLSRIDANVNLTGVQHFVLVDAFTNTAGQVTLSYNSGTNITSLSADTNGDGVADMLIRIDGNHEAFDNFIFGGG